MGIGPAAATKLLRAFGSADAFLLAAARGEAKGWSPAVQAIAQDSGKREQLARNQRLVRYDCRPEVLTAAQRADLLAAVQRQRPSGEAAGPGGSVGQCALACLHPFPVGRWRLNRQHLDRLSQRLGQLGVSHELCSTTPAGLPVDALAELPAAAAGGCGSPGQLPGGGVALIVLGRCDFAAEAGLPGAGVCTPAGIASVGQLLELGSAVGAQRQLNPAMRRYLSELRKGAAAVVCIPWWNF
jgi:hypothetical protein